MFPEDEPMDLEPCTGNCEYLEESEAIRKEWKKVAMEFDELRARVQEVGQVLDGDLIDHATQLRYGIWNFSLQNFGNETQQQDIPMD